MSMFTYQRMNFTRSVRKIVLMKDDPNLGFAGEVCFVKPGHAFNDLVPTKKAVFFSDPAAKKFLETVKPEDLKKK
jgi:ribosomal protein L9